MIFLALLQHVLFADDVNLDNAAGVLGLYSLSSLFFPAVSVAQINPILQTVFLVLSIAFVTARFAHWIYRRVKGERTDTSGL